MHPRNRSVSTWRQLSAVVGAVLLGGCGAHPPNTTPRPLPGWSLLVLREGTLHTPDALEDPYIKVDRPVVVEAPGPLKAGFFTDTLLVRVRLPKGGVLVAIREGSDGSPSKTNLLGRYVVRRTTLWHRPGRQAVGHALPGAFLPLYADGKPYARVLLPGYWVNSTGANQHVPIPNRSGSPVVYVRAVDLGVQIPPKLPRSDPWTTPTRGDAHTLYLAPNGFDFSKLRCGPARVLKRQGDWALVAQLREGVEVRGWVDHPLLPSRGGNSCGSYTIALGMVPRQFVTWDTPTRPARRRPRPAPPKPQVVGPRGAMLRSSYGTMLGWLPPGARLLKLVPDSPSPPLGRFRVGSVVVDGRVNWSRVGPHPGIRPLTAPPPLINPTVRPAPQWRKAADPARMRRRFIREILARRRRLWRRISETAPPRCEPLSFRPARRKRGSLWSETREVRISADGCHRTVSGYGVEIKEDALLVFFGPDYETTAIKKCRKASDSDSLGSAGCFWMVQVVGMSQKGVLVVPASRYAVSRYATEDLGVFYYRRRDCLGSPPARAVRGCR